MSKKSLVIPKSSHVIADTPSRVKTAAVADLAVVNSIIASAVESWLLPDRLKRLTLPMLQYSEADLTEFQCFVFEQSGSGKGVAALSRNTSFVGQSGSRCALLHGLYVHAGSQRSGVGRILQQAMAEQARKSGCKGLLVKAQRVSRSYFESHDYVECEHPTLNYPYLYWKAI